MKKLIILTLLIISLTKIYGGSCQVAWQGYTYTNSKLDPSSSACHSWRNAVMRIQ